MEYIIGNHGGEVSDENWVAAISEKVSKRFECSCCWKTFGDHHESHKHAHLTISKLFLS